MVEINKSCTYILPLFCKYFKNKNNFLEENLFKIFLKNCFCLKQDNNKQYKEFIIQFEKIKESNIFDNFLANLEKIDIFVNKYQIKNDVFFSFSIPKEFIDTYEKYIFGKFSEINEEHKRNILTFCKKYISKEISIEIHQIFSKNNSRKKKLEEKLGMKLPDNIELSSKPNLKKETFNLVL